MTAAPRSRDTSRPFMSSISTRCRLGSYNVTSFNALNIATVMSGSLFFVLLPSGFVLFPERKHARSFDSLLSFLHLKVILGVTSDPAGSCWLRSRADAEGCRNVCCGISNSHDGVEPHDPDFCLTVICWSGLYSWIANSAGNIGSGGGGTPPFSLTASADCVGCVHSGMRRTSPKRTSGLCAS